MIDSGKHRVAAISSQRSTWCDCSFCCLSCRVRRPLIAQEWPEFRGPGGQGHSSERGLPLEWGESKNVAWKTPVPGLGWSSPVVADGRVWLTTRDRAARHFAARARVRRRPPGREVVNVEAFNIPSYRREINPKNSWASPTPVIDNGRVYVHFGADGTAALSHVGRDRVEDPLRLRIAARRRRIADRLRRSPDLQLRRQRRGVRRRARQAHRQGEVEDQSRVPGGSGVHDAARDSRRRIAIS